MLDDIRIILGSRNFVMDLTQDPPESNDYEHEFADVLDMYREAPDSKNSSSLPMENEYSLNGDSAAGTLFKTKEGSVVVRQCENYAFRGENLNQLVRIRLITPEDSPAFAHGAKLFQTFRLIKLKEQMTAMDDPVNMGMFDRLRNPPTGRSPVSLEDISKIKVLSTDDIINDSSGITAPIVVITNKERHSYSAQRSNSFATIKRKNRYVWNLPIRGDGVAGLEQDKINEIYRSNIEFKNYFVQGAPGYLTKNINPAIGLANGTAVVYHSLILDDMEDSKTIFERIRNATSTIDILLKYPPKFVCIEVATADPTRFVNQTLVLGKLVIPIPFIKDNKELNLQTESSNTTVVTEKHSVDLKFSNSFNFIT